MSLKPARMTSTLLKDKLHLDPGMANVSPPPTVESRDRWPTPQEIYKQLFRIDAPDVEVFDFGAVPDSLLKKEAVRAAPLLARGLLDIPFERVLFRYLFLPDDIELDLDGSAMPAEMTGEDGKMLPQPYVTLIVRQPEHHWLAVDLSTMPDLLKRRLNLPASPRQWDVACAGTICSQIDEKGEARWLAGNRFYAQTAALPPEYHAEATDRLLGGLADTIASFSLLLNAKNVPQRIEHPPAKVNAKRAKSGKPLLTRVTYIDGARYTTAIRNTARGGVHASPVPHLRRGHIRHRYNRTFWVRDCIVNARSRDDINARSKYNVDTDRLAHGTVETD